MDFIGRHNLTVREISKLTGLSTTTVCKALRNPASVRESTWKEIEKFAGSAKGLSISDIHIILPDLKNSFFGNLLEGCIEALYSKKFAPLVHLTQDNPTTEQAIFSQIPNRSTQGIIWVPSSYETGFCPPHSSVVVADRDCHSSGEFSKVLLDNSNLAFSSIEYLASFKPDRIFFINGPKESSASQNREEGALAAAHKHNLRLEVFYADFTKDKEAYDIAKGLLLANTKSAFLLGNQSIAFGFLQAFSESGLSNRPPCITFDRIPKIFSPPLSFIDLPGFKIGEKAAQLLLEGKTRASEQVIFTIQGSLNYY